MPFTLSHAAAALPLRRLLRGGAVFPALVIGCFIPDVPYFLPEPLASINAHLLPGLVIFGIPCGWAMYWFWQHALRGPAAALLPRAYANLVFSAPSSAAQTPRWWSITLSLLVGALSHVVWDAFTHRRGVVVHAWPALARPIVHVHGHALPPYFIFQDISTLLGLLCLAMHVRYRLQQAATNRLGATAPQLPTGAKVAVLAALALGTVVLLGWMFSGPNAPVRSVYNFVCCTISASATVTVAYALAWHAGRRLASARHPR